jgi:hypothetical protein
VCRAQRITHCAAIFRPSDLPTTAMATTSLPMRASKADSDRRPKPCGARAPVARLIPLATQGSLPASASQDFCSTIFAARRLTKIRRGSCADPIDRTPSIPETRRAPHPFVLEQQQDVPPRTSLTPATVDSIRWQKLAEPLTKQRQGQTAAQVPRAERDRRQKRSAAHRSVASPPYSTPRAAARHTRSSQV